MVDKIFTTNYEVVIMFEKSKNAIYGIPNDFISHHSFKDLFFCYIVFMLMKDL